MTKGTGLHTGDDSFKCDYCKGDFHEACEDIMLMNNGAYKCNCVCNTPVDIPK